MVAGCHGKSVDELVGLIMTRVASERTRVEGALDVPSIDASVKVEYQRLLSSIEGDQDEWKLIIPGRPLLAQFAAKTGLDIARIKRLHLQQAIQSDAAPF
jgi:hypothetical protein